MYIISSPFHLQRRQSRLYGKTCETLSAKSSKRYRKAAPHMMESRPCSTWGLGLTSVLCCFWDLSLHQDRPKAIWKISVSNMFVAAANEYDNEDAEFQEEV
jgi:hypothetical protein